MPWYWILIILSAIVGPFEAMHALNKARSRRDAARRKRGGSNDTGESARSGSNGLNCKEREEAETGRERDKNDPAE